MALLGVDTRWWNLTGVAVTAMLAGCGPQVLLDEDGVADGDQADDGVDDSDEGIGDLPPPAECVTNSECGAGWVCGVGGVCEPEPDSDDCIDGGCCDGCDDDDYYDDDYYDDDYYDDDYHDDYYDFDCYSDRDCDADEFCELEFGGGYCAPLPGPPVCEDGPELSQLAATLDGPSDIVSLSFVDIDGDAAEDLVVGRQDEATVHLGPDGATAVTLPIPQDAVVTAAASGDFDSDGDADLVVNLSTGGLALLLADETGAFTLPEGNLHYLAAPNGLAVLDFDGDGALDAAVSGPSTMLLRGNGMGAFMESVDLTTETAHGIVVSTPAAAPASLLAAWDGAIGEWYAGDDTADTTVDVTHFEDADVPAWFPLSTGAGAQRTLVGVGREFDETTLRVSVGDSDSVEYTLPNPTAFAERGDLDGDGIDEFALVYGSLLTSLRVGAEGGIECVAESSLAPVTAEVLAVGDLDGDGRDEVAAAQDGTVHIFEVP